MTPEEDPSHKEFVKRYATEQREKEYQKNRETMKQVYLREAQEITSQLSILEQDLQVLLAYAKRHGATDEEIEDASHV